MRTWWIVALVVTVGVAAVAFVWPSPSPPPTPTLIDAADAVDQHVFHFTLRDEEVTVPVDDVTLVDSPSDADLRVLWTGLGCHRAPTVTVEREASDGLHITLERGPIVTDRETDCPGAEVRHGLDLVLTHRVDLDSVRVTINGA